MPVIFQTGYVLPTGDYPLTHARIGHAGNWYSGGTAVASTTAAGYFADQPMNSLTYEKWKPTSAAATWEYNHGSAVTVDYCAILGKLGSNGNTLTVQYWNGSAWVAVSPAVALTDDMPIMAIFAPLAAQRWRISLSGGTAPEIAVVKFGRALQMPVKLLGNHQPIDLSRQTTMRANRSETNEWLGRTKQRTELESTIGWEHLSPAWVRANWEPFQKALESEPFFLAWRPLTFPEVSFCQCDSVPIPKNMGVRGLMEVAMQVRAYAYD